VAEIGHAATPPGPPGRARPRPRAPIELAQALVATAFSLWWRLRRRPKLGPDLGFVSQRLEKLDLEGACPDDYPSGDLLDPHLLDTALTGQPTKELARVTAWALALESNLERVIRHRRPDRGLTTVGLAWVEGRVRLCVIRYVRIRSALRLEPSQAVLDGHEFPVITRPLLEQRHGLGRNGAAGLCWVTLDEGDQPRRGLLTARHAVLPKSAPLGANVRLDLPRAPSPCHLLRSSTMMDAAVVELPAEEWRGREQVAPSSTVGLKPIRLLGTSGTVEGDIIEFSGVSFGVIPAQAGVEPVTPVQFILNCRLRRGDSGCVGLDLEPARFGADTPPYLLYLGVKNLGFGGVTGYGQMLEQVRLVWNLDFYR
jgi:hypothetical protein